MAAVHVIVGLVILQRLGELVLAHANTRRLLAQGAEEAGRGHYPLFILLHTTWLAAILWTTPAGGKPAWAPLALLLALMVARVWVIACLGRYWTTRIISLPGEPLIRRGPYRLIRHPNYLVVAGEVATLPLVFGNWPVAFAFSVLNGMLLAHRIAIEDQALAPRRVSARGRTDAPG